MFCNSLKNACGIPTNGLERVYKTELETGERRELARVAQFAFVALRLVSCDLENKTDYFAVYSLCFNVTGPVRSVFF